VKIRVGKERTARENERQERSAISDINSWYSGDTGIPLDNRIILAKQITLKYVF